MTPATLKALKDDDKPVRILRALITEARQRHDDILTEPTWNPDYTLELSLKVSEIRELAAWLKSTPKRKARR